ncbi:hypothetical protein KO494_15700 [Lacinutrix sp. C3R15]|uniref:hypothetical protein n=1 Tax=Flavobacteriaceae TaxID=49546 RepID=UPI001C0976F5|nr:MULTISPECIES: hypothetical protein [Flavobacteriaceae]MBU2940995.1 hypothetical protein [Lacinutrix sp. C3R15]MDO6624314.1 hypothetical protein [Oceanihabitans sp. 1_MG-2023]
MKKGLLLLSCIFLLLQGCSSESENDDSSACGTVNLISVTQNGNTLNFNYQSQNAFNYYEIGYDQTASVANQGNNLFFNYSFTTTNASNASIDDENLSFFAENNQTLSFYIRAQCTNGDLTDWQGPIVLNVDEFCEKPYDFDVQNGTAFWETYNNQTNASYFQVQYGSQGFQIGNGEVITTNDESTSDAALASGNTYDFYVRSFCTNNLGFSNWEGPVTYYAEYDQNLCNPPSNVTTEVERNASGQAIGAVFRWDYNGESNFEHVVVLNNSTPDSGTIYTSDTGGWPLYNLSQNTDFDFYIRAVCTDGTRTEWVGPKDINIGY